MRSAKRILASLYGACFACLAVAQSLQVTGTARLSSGTSLNFVQVRLKNSEGKVVGHGVTNGAGKFAVAAARGELRLECEARKDSSGAYAQNPVILDPFEIPPGKNSKVEDCVFDQDTPSAEYWHKVVTFTEVKAQQSKDPNAAEDEWIRVTSLATLPPGSKAELAHQFMLAKHNIADPTFEDYLKVNPDKLSKAVDGNRNAIDSLPKSVAKDVETYQQQTAK
jgi:hypothetical protein